jgi:hypothetical protein
MSNQVVLSIPTAADQGFQQVVQVNDYFKFLDERSYVKIAAISSGVPNGDVTEYTLTLEKNHPYEGMYHYYSNSLKWGGTSRLVVDATGATKTTEGSYSIYPVDLSGTKPSYLYQTWNISNYVTSNAFGQGIHGDIRSSVLADFYEGDKETGRLHKAVIWANDAPYGIGNERDRNVDGILDTDTIQGFDEYYLSTKDLAVLSEFLNNGGRVLTGGQNDPVPTIPDPVDLATGIGDSANQESFYSSQLGIALEKDAKTSSVLYKTDSDPITNDHDKVSILEGFGEASQKIVDRESLNTNENAQQLALVNGIAAPIFTYSTSSLKDPAAVRVSAGKNATPWAAVYLGFDFSTMTYSGVRNVLEDVANTEFAYGRNLFMKKSLDWLRDPTRTGLLAARVFYTIENQDGTSFELPLDFSNGNSTIVDDVLHRANQDPLQFLGVGPNQDLRFRVEGGLIYDKTDYSWKIASSAAASSSAKLTYSSTVSDNSFVTFRTGATVGQTSILQVTSPDGESKNINVITKKQPLKIWIPNSGANVINGKMVYTAGQKIDFRVSGGDGVGSYSYSVIADSNYKRTALTENSELRTVTYEVPADVAPESKVNVIMGVSSGSDFASATLEIFPKVKFVNNELILIEGGVGESLTASGGNPADENGAIVGYDYSNPDGLLLLEPGTTSVSVKTDPNIRENVSVTNRLSEDPNNPTMSSVIVSDKVFTSATATAAVKIYSRPRLYYQLSDNTFDTIASGNLVTIPSSGVLNLMVLGGTGNTTVEVIDTPLALTSEKVLTVMGNTIGIGDTAVNFPFSSNLMTLRTGSLGGQVFTLRFSVGTFDTDITFTLTSPIGIQYKIPGVSNFSNYTGSTVAVKYRTNGAASSTLQMYATSGNAPFNWTFQPDLLGGFILPKGSSSSAQEFIRWSSGTDAGNTLLGDINFSSNISSGVNETVFFTGGITPALGTIVVTDGDGNESTVSMRVSPFDSILWNAGSFASTASDNLRFKSRGRFSFSGGSPPYTVSLSSSGGNPIAGFQRITPRTSIDQDTYVTDLTIEADANGDVKREFTLVAFSEPGTVSVTVTDVNGMTKTSELINIGRFNTGLTSSTDAKSQSLSEALGGSSGGGGCLLR